MYIKNINILNFRNYDSLLLNFSKNINIIYGQNGQGKTNLLESIYVLGLTKSHRVFIDNNLIKNNKDYSIVKGKIKNSYLPMNLEVTINQKNTKRLKVDNNLILKNSNYISLLNIIIFYPEDLELIKGTPADRRRYLNLEISQFYSNYINLNNDFKKILKIRNDYLKKIDVKNIFDENYLDVINDYFIKKSIQIFKFRNKYIERINEYCNEIYKNITGLNNFKIIYKPSCSFENFEDKSMYDIMKKKINKLYNIEKKIKNTLIGPQRDDIEFYLDGENLKNYGSQGQQRIAILAIKLSELEMFKKYKNINPILLLDDVFSELDENKKNNLLKYLKKDVQTIITTTSLNEINEKIIKKAKLIKINNGKIEKIEEVKKNERK